MTKIGCNFCISPPKTLGTDESASGRPALAEPAQCAPRRLEKARRPRRDAVCQAWDLAPVRQPLPKPQSGQVAPLARLADDVVFKIMQELSPKNTLGLAATCRAWRLRSRDAMLWTAPRLSAVSAFRLATLPADIQELPAVRATRFAAQAAAAIESGDESLLRALCTHPFAGIE